MINFDTMTRGVPTPMNDEGFDALVQPHQRALHAHCYRMLASLHDADDALQETLLRAWKGFDGFDGRSSLRTWLYTIATNVCLRAMERRQRHFLPIDTSPSSEVSTATWERVDVWPDPYPTGGRDSPEHAAVRSETLGLAFVAALQWLPASQRAVLMLREVHGYSASETATMLEMSATAVNSSLQRARRTLASHAGTKPHGAQLEPARQAQLVRLYVEAWELGDIHAVLDLLTEDATFQMPPMATWFRGRSAIAEFLPTGPLAERWRMLPTEANGQPAFGCYAWKPVAGTFEAHSLDVVSTIGMRISDITSFLHPELLTRFGLPKHLDPSDEQQTQSRADESNRPCLTSNRPQLPTPS
ncbi:MAG TPA: sigma-70 family RNA polymerase sigma factor [Ilumatobacter sp.]|nr:sigma-70 family RNA polymerase sigma factor [Ilumatobacter sp.]